MKKKELERVTSIIERYAPMINCTINLMGIIITDPERLDCADSFDGSIDVQIMDSRIEEINKERVLEKIAKGDFKVTCERGPDGFIRRLDALLNKKNIASTANMFDNLEEFVEELQDKMNDISCDYADKLFGDEWHPDMFYEQISISYKYFSEDGVIVFGKEK
jgi:hypothetical protein